MPVNAALEGVAPVLERATRPPPGSAPGLLASVPGATPPRVSVFAYGPHDAACLLQGASGIDPKQPQPYFAGQPSCQVTLACSGRSG